MLSESYDVVKEVYIIAVLRLLGSLAQPRDSGW